MHVCTHTCMHAYMHVHTHIYTHIHTYAHICTHTAESTAANEDGPDSKAGEGGRGTSEAMEALAIILSAIAVL